MIGKQISHYRIEEKIAEGGMGVVYKASDVLLLRPGAIKILLDHLVSYEKNHWRFIREARAASALNHPNICTIHDIGQVDTRHYIVMEFIAGETLRASLDRRGALSEGEAVDIAIKLCGALAAAHAKGIIHRDLKPANIMTSQEGLVKIMDFGVAKLAIDVAKSSPPTVTESAPVLDWRTVDQWQPSAQTLNFTGLLGTASYMSPEQADDLDIDHRSDLFSFGIVLYEMITGRLPFHGSDVLTVLQAILENDPLPIEASGQTICTELKQVVAKTLHKEPDRRYQQAADILTALEDIKAKISSGSSARVKKRTKRAKPVVVASLSLTVVIMALLFVLRFTGAFDVAALLHAPPKSDAFLAQSKENKYVIAVAPFWGTDAQAATEGKVMQVLIERKLHEQLGSEVDVAIIGKDDIQVVRSHEEAKAVGKRCGATLVIWGEIVSLRGEIEFQPYLTFADRDSRIPDDSPESILVSLGNTSPIRARKTPAEVIGNLTLFVTSTYYNATGDADRALSVIRRISDRSIEMMCFESLLLHGTGEEQEAMSLAQEALRRDPKYPNANYLSAYYYADQGRTEQAISQYHKTIKLDPQNAGSYDQLGVIYRKMGRYVDAVAYHQKAIERRPLRPDYRVHLGYVYYAQNDYDKAIEQFYSAVRLGTKNPQYFYDLGDTYLRLGKYREAGEWLHKTLDVTRKPVSPNDMQQYSWTHHMLGLIYQHQGESDKAIAQLQDAIRFGRRKEQHYLGLAALYFAQGKNKQAAAAAAETIDRKPNDAYAHLLHFLALYRLAHIEEARENLFEFAATLPQDKWMAPVVHYYNGTRTEEEVLNHDKLRDNGRQCEAYCYLGMARLLGLPDFSGTAVIDSTRAADYFRKCLATGVRDFLEYEMAYAELRQLEGEKLR